MKKNFLRKITSVVLLGAIAMTMVSSCGNKTGKIEANRDIDVSFPLKEPVTISYWCKLPDSVSNAGYASLGETPLYEELKKRTGIDIQFSHPPKGNEKEKLGLMFASLELPDIIEGDISGAYPGGVNQALADGVIYDLKPMLEKYAPNFSAILEKYPEIRMDIENADGQIGYIPYIRGDASLMTYMGLFIRQDWLDELGLEVPETIDDWHTVLTAFKEKKGATAPLCLYNSDITSVQLMGAFGIKDDYFIEDGKVKYGVIDPRCKEYIKTLAQWYKEGLIDPEFIVNDSKTMDAKIMNGQAGAFIGYVGSGMKKYLDYMKDTNPTFNLTGCPYPTLNKDDKVKFVQKSGPVVTSYAAMITTNNKNPELSLALLDYGFSEEGHMLYNFGIEGESYNMENGYPKYTETITNNPEGLSMFDSLGMYTRSGGDGIFVQDPRYMEQYANYPQQIAAMNTWSEDCKSAIEANNDWKGILTTEEQKQITQKQVEINTLKSETLSKWVLGDEDVETGFDKFVETVNQIGIQDIINIKQAAYDRYLQQFPEAKNATFYNVNDFYTKQ